MATFYSGIQEDIQRILQTTVQIGTGKADALSTPDLEGFQKDADSVIDGHLSPTFFTPLVKITRAGVSFFPHPIPYIASRLVAGMIIKAVYSQIEPNTTEIDEDYTGTAMRELRELHAGVLKGTRHLEGQRLRARNRFVNPAIAPLEQPPGRERL